MLILKIRKIIIIIIIIIKGGIYQFILKIVLHIYREKTKIYYSLLIPIFGL